MTSPLDDLSEWQDQLTQHIEQRPGPFVKRIEVIAETSSTQDECRRLANNQPGLLVATLRQTAGRGRLGRAWVDETGEGVAVTLSVPRVASPGRLAIAAGLAVCQAVEALGVGQPKIRWPNDVMASNRKLAGILIEQSDDLAFIGIGLNVRQTSWPEELAAIAVSLVDLGVSVSRPDVIGTLIDHLNETLQWDDAQLVHEFTPRDILRGTRQTFEHHGEQITGTVIDLDPLKGLSIATETQGPCFLPAETTSLVHSV